MVLLWKAVGRGQDTPHLSRIQSATRVGVPALTHGPLARGAHTTRETVSLDELVRVARVYTLTAVAYC